MSKKYSLRSNGPPSSSSSYAHRFRKSLDSSSNFLSRAAARPKDESYPLRRKSLDGHSSRKEARNNNNPHGMDNRADADQFQLEKQKAAAWVWHERSVGEVVAPTKRSAIASLHKTPPSSLSPSSPHDSAIDAVAVDPVKSRFCTEALKKEQQEHKTKQEMHAKQLHVNSAPTALANSNKEAKLAPLYDALDLSSLKDQMTQFVQNLQHAELQQKPAKSEEPAGISSKRMMMNKKLDNGSVGMPNSPQSDISSNRIMRSMKLDTEPMNSFHSYQHDHVSGYMNENDQYRANGDNRQRPIAGGSVRLSTDYNARKIPHQGQKGNFRNPFIAIRKLFHKISKAMKGSSEGGASHGDKRLEESTFDHADPSHLHATHEHNYQHYHHHHHHHHYYHHNFIHVDGDHRQSEQDVNAFTKEMVFRRRRFSDSYVGKDEMNIKQRSPSNFAALVDESVENSGTTPSPMRRRRHSGSEDLFSTHNSPNHSIRVYAKRSGCLPNNGEITGLGYYSPRMGRSVWAYPEEEDDAQTTDNKATVVTSSDYLLSQASRLANSPMHSKVEECKENLSAPRQRRFSESFTDYDADARLRNHATTLASIQMKYRGAALLDKTTEGLFSCDHNSPNINATPVRAKTSYSSPSLANNGQIIGQGYSPGRLHGRSIGVYSQEGDHDDQTIAIAAPTTSPYSLSSQASRFSNPRRQSKLEDHKEALSAHQRRFSESFADHQANHVRLSKHL